MRESGRQIGRQADFRKQVSGTCQPLVPIGMAAARLHCLRDDAGNASPWIKRRIGILKYHLQALGAQVVITRRSRTNVLAVEQDAPGRSEEHTSELQSRENLVC